VRNRELRKTRRRKPVKTDDCLTSPSRLALSLTLLLPLVPSLRNQVSPVLVTSASSRKQTGIDSHYSNKSTLHTTIDPELT